MYLQGNLQKVFDALYEMGVIDPVLEMDWEQSLRSLPDHYEPFLEAVNLANRYQSQTATLITELKKIKDQAALQYLAMEVAREFADFHARKILH